MKKKFTKKNDLIIKKAQSNFKQIIETKAKDMNKSEHVSLRDACSCTGNGWC